MASGESGSIVCRILGQGDEEEWLGLVEVLRERRGGEGEESCSGCDDGLHDG